MFTLVPAMLELPQWEATSEQLALPFQASSNAVGFSFEKKLSKCVSHLHDFPVFFLSSWKDLKPCHRSRPAVHAGQLPRPACVHHTHP